MEQLLAFAKESRPFLLALATIFFALSTSLLFHSIKQTLDYFFRGIILGSRKSISEDLAATLAALEDNSKKATDLLTQLQSEISNRTKAVQEIERDLKKLQEQRTLLELTADQKKAIESLVRRQPSPREIFSSVDFWLGRVLVSAMFFLAGITINLWLRR